MSEPTATERALLNKILHLEAHCAALETFVVLLARKAGLPEDRVATGIRHLTSKGYQDILEHLESIDPAEAAKLDARPEMPPLPEEFL